MGWGRNVKGQQRNWQCYPVSWNFLSFMNIPILEGRNFQPSDEECENGIFIFNEEAKKEFGLTLEDKVDGHMGETDIAGFCADFNFASLRTKVMPFSFYVFGKNAWRSCSYLFVRTAPGADFGELKKFIENTISEYDANKSADFLNIRFFDDTLQSVYSKESKLSSLITLFTILAIIISLMGVFGLVMIEAEGRRKEIGVRRVNGATVGEILEMLNSKFVYIVLICFVIAAPLSIFIMRAYLNNFAYRIGLHPWVFIVALLAVLIVTIAVVTLRSWRAATANPVESLRTE
jgi:putative ABC transport system permease protein